MRSTNRTLSIISYGCIVIFYLVLFIIMEGGLTTPGIHCCHDENHTGTKNFTSISAISKEEEEERNYYYGQRSVVNPFNFDYIMAPKNLCAEDTFVLITLFLPPMAVDHRSAIRETWGSVVRGGSWPSPSRQPRHTPVVKLVFLLGHDTNYDNSGILEEEQQKYNDIVQFNFKDTYSNITTKALAGLKFVLDYCSHVEYVVKVDDDVFINVPYLLSLLQNNTAARTIMGKVFQQASDRKVIRSGQGKYATSRKVFPFDEFPIYAGGSAYIISTSLISELFSKSAYVPWFRNEDVFVTGVLRKMVRGNIVDTGHVSDNFASIGPCDFLEDSLLWNTDYRHPNRMRITWGSMWHKTNCSN